MTWKSLKWMIGSLFISRITDTYGPCDKINDTEFD